MVVLIAIGIMFFKRTAAVNHPLANIRNNPETVAAALKEDSGLN